MLKKGTPGVERGATGFEKVGNPPCLERGPTGPCGTYATTVATPTMLGVDVGPPDSVLTRGVSELLRELDRPPRDRDRR